MTGECDCVLSQHEKVKECYLNDLNGEVRHQLTFVEDLTVVHNRLLEEWREAGFELYAFGQNLEDSDNCTATFTEVGR